MTKVTWYAFEDPKTKREYYFEPVSNKTTWTLPTSSTPVKTNTAGGAGVPPAIPASPASPMIGDIFAPSPVSAKIKDEKKQTRAERGGSSNARGFGRRDIAKAIGTILLLNTLSLGILVKFMYNSSSVVDVAPMTNSKIVPSVDNARLEPVDVDSSEIVEDVDIPDADTENDSTDAVPVHFEDEEEVKGNEPIQSEIEEEEYAEELVSVMNEENAEEEAVVSDSSSSSDSEDKAEKKATVSDSTSPKILTREKIISIITPVFPILVGYGAARIAIALIAKVLMIFSPPAPPVVTVVKAAGPIAMVKTFFERILGRSSPAAIVVKDPTLLEKITSMFAKLFKMK